MHIAMLICRSVLTDALVLDQVAQNRGRFKGLFTSDSIASIKFKVAHSCRFGFMASTGSFLAFVLGI